MKVWDPDHVIAPAMSVFVEPSAIEVVPSVIVELVRPEFGIVALIWLGAMLIRALDAAVSWPCALTVNAPTELALP